MTIDDIELDEENQLIKTVDWSKLHCIAQGVPGSRKNVFVSGKSKQNYLTISLPSKMYNKGRKSMSLYAELK